MKFGRRRALAGGAAVLGLPLLDGCGFRPVYGRDAAGDSPVDAALAEVSVAPIGERYGQLMRNALLARIHRREAGVAQRYDLRVSVALLADAVGINPDTSASRLRLTGSATWTLARLDTQRTTLSSGTARSTDGFDIISAQLFQADQDSDATIRRITEAMADQITLQVAGYFRRHPVASIPAPPIG